MFPWFTDKSASVHSTVLWEVNPRTSTGTGSTPFSGRTAESTSLSCSTRSLDQPCQQCWGSSSTALWRSQRNRLLPTADSPRNMNPWSTRSLMSSITKHLVQNNHYFGICYERTSSWTTPVGLFVEHTCMQRWILTGLKPPKIQGGWFCLQLQQWVSGELHWPQVV